MLGLGLMRGSTVKIYFNHCFLLLWFSLMMACSERNSSQAEAGTMAAPEPDKVAEVEVKRLQPSVFNHELVSNGKLVARRHASLRFESVGVITHIYVKNGDQVSAGQKLATLDLYRLSNKVTQTRDALEKATLELQDVLIGQGGYLLKDSAKIPRDIMKLARVKSGYDLAVAQADLALYERRHAMLTAPFAGVVANLFSRPLNTSSATEPFCTIIDNNQLEAAFSVLENELPLISPGDRVQIEPMAMTGKVVPAVVSEINPMVDANGMVQVKALVSGGRTGLVDGMNVRVSVQRPVPGQLVVPKDAVVLRSGKQVLFTLKNGRAFWNYVVTKLANSSSYTVSGETLKPGDSVIISGNMNLAHESPVVVKR